MVRLMYVEACILVNMRIVILSNLIVPSFVPTPRIEALCTLVRAII